VVKAIEQGVELQELSLSDLQSFSDFIDEDVYGALSLENTLQTKAQLGGTSPAQVAKALAIARVSLAE
jgi:argininosuccinate lyase